MCLNRPLTAYISVVNPHAMSMDQKKESVIVRPEQREMSIGLMLGDAYLQITDYRLKAKARRIDFDSRRVKNTRNMFTICVKDLITGFRISPGW
jgi:hypothetical protein